MRVALCRAARIRSSSAPFNGRAAAGLDRVGIADKSGRRGRLQSGRRSACARRPASTTARSRV